MDKLAITYEEFPEENIRVLTVARGDEAINMFYGNEAKGLYNKLIKIKENSYGKINDKI